MNQRSRSMKIPRSSKGRGFVQPAYSHSARLFMKGVGGLYLNLFEKVKSVELLEAERLTEALDEFYNGKKRILFAFRHVAKEDAPVMMYALSRPLAKEVRRTYRKKARKMISHAQFLYGRDVLNWAGRAAAWLFPRIGCIPVQNRGTNKEGMDILKELMASGPFPIALAPEGQVTYHMYHCSDISSGISQLASWGERETQDVLIIPIALGYRYAEEPVLLIHQVLSMWEKRTGITLTSSPESPVARIQEAFRQTLSILESFYRLERIPETDDQRVSQICHCAMSRAEQLAGKRHTGTLLDRLFTVRYAGAYAIRPESFDPKECAPAERSIADFRALEAHVYLRHSQIVDILQYLSEEDIYPGCSGGRACEAALNILDLINRLEGGNINSRYTPKHKRAYLYTGTSISLKEHLPQGLSPRKRRAEIKKATQDALEMISRELEGAIETTLVP